MLNRHSITYHDEYPFTRKRVLDIVAGDEVLVWDARSSCWVWHTVAEVGELNDRMKIRVAGEGFFFDFGIVKDHAPRYRAV